MDTNLQPNFGSINRQWEALAKTCLDGDSQVRLNTLLDHLKRLPARQAASASAEIETGYFLVQAGFSLAFLEADNSPERAARFDFRSDESPGHGPRTDDEMSLGFIGYAIELDEPANVSTTDGGN